MRADLYICDETFSYNGKDSPRQIKYKLLLFHDLIERIRVYEAENKIHLVKENFLTTPLCKNGTTVEDILFSYEESKKKYGREIVILFQSLFDHSSFSYATTSDMKEYLGLETPDECNAILVLNKLSGYENNVQVLGTINGWLKFRRYYLGKYPGTEEYFITECKKYYPGISFGLTAHNEVDEVLESHSNQIINCLTILEERLLPDFTNYKGNNIDFIKIFGKTYGLDGASYQGDKDSKFDFEFEDGNIRYCETHLKMNEDDSGNKKQYCRIYFKPPHKDDKRVYVGYICRHL